VRCAVPLARRGTCGACNKRAPDFDAVTACFQYRFPLDRLVQRFKYAGDLALGHWLGERLAERVRGCERPDLIIAPPSTTIRLRERGFNPALEMAKVVARSLEIPCVLEGLVRIRDTTPQEGLGREARARNLEGAMHCILPLAGMSVALVDDVMTTGATANAAARVLKRAGAARVSVWVAARTP
jgi:ComF family protein